ncbi:MAG: helix-turn-helix transcriptional regulator [Clostridia bacterium]|nr:helix-turn-helix transcriptional regulator [Clostridia bacterium]
MKNKLSQRIKELRIENGYNQSELANLCKVKQSCVSKWERGETLPDVEMIIVLSELFSVSTDYLIGIKDF